MNPLYTYTYILLPTIIAFIVVLLVIGRYRGYVEEEPIGEIRTVSPALKIIKLIFSKTITSIEILIILISLYLLTVVASFTASYTYSMRIVNLEDKPYLFDVAGISSAIDVISRIEKIRYTVIIAQVYRALLLDIDNRTSLFYPLLIKCGENSVGELVSGVAGPIKLLIELCRALESNNTILLNRDLDTATQIVNLDGVKYNIIAVNLKPLLNIELVSGVYILHFIGSMGGEVIRLEDVNKVVLLRFTQNNFNMLCRDGCDARIMTLYIDVSGSSTLNTIIDEYKQLFDYAIVRRNGTGFMYSSTFIPTPESIVGLLILFTISVIILLSLSGGLIEKLSYVTTNLWSMGVPKELYWASSILTLAIIFGVAALPIAACYYIGWLNSFGLTAYLVMSIATASTLSNQLVRKLSAVQPTPHRSSISHVSEKYIDVENLRECFTRLLQGDDILHLNEIEVLRDSEHYALRVELIYGRALSTITVAEIYVEGYDSLWRYAVDVDVWSIEEFTAREVKYITLLALSKIYGGLTYCIERLP